MSRKYLIRIAELESQLRQKDQQLSLVEETEAFLRSALARAEEKIEEDEREIEHLRAQIEKLRRMLFGTCSEKLRRAPLMLTDILQAHLFNQAILQGFIDPFHAAFGLAAVGTNQFDRQFPESPAELGRAGTPTFRSADPEYGMLVTVKCDRFTIFINVLSCSHHVVERVF